MLTAAVAQQLPPNLALQPLTKEFSPAQIDGELRKQLHQLGLINFIHHYALPLLQVLDQGWTEGSLSIAREHLVSDRLEQLLREQLATEQPTNSQKQLPTMNMSGTLMVDQMLATMVIIN